ncbi:MAG: glucokinase [Chloroflexi bacterium]|nr:MAG: glucokinase [Chloroflexota bacterium]
MLLVGDIGGTKTDLAIIPLTGDIEPEVESTFKSAEHASLEEIIEIFLANTQLSVSRAVFGIAGPVVDGTADVTNLSWPVMSETHLAEKFNLSVVKLLNDLEIIAHAVPHLPDTDLLSINGGQVERALGQHKAVVAPGTGLGEAILFHHAGGYQVVASEGGHASFAPHSLFEIGLLKHLMEKYNHVSYERVCSGGLGIPNIYNYLKENGYATENPQVEAELAQTSDPTPVIIQAGLNQNSELCIETLNAFVSILGSEAGNVALKAMTLGGIYLGGGIPPRIVPKLQDGTFMAAFVKKGRFSDMLARIPVYVILNKKPALVGAAYYGRAL